MEADPEIYLEAAHEAVQLANRLADEDRDADLWDIADGLIAGAVHYWLYSRQPCGDPQCDDCDPVNTAEGRMKALFALVQQYAEESDYYHSPQDTNVGRA